MKSQNALVGELFGTIPGMFNISPVYLVHAGLCEGLRRQLQEIDESVLRKVLSRADSLLVGANLGYEHFRGINFAKTCI
jgi:hypothetical protein